MDVRPFELLIRVIPLFIASKVRDIRYRVCIKATARGAVQTTRAGIWNRHRVRVIDRGEGRGVRDGWPHQKCYSPLCMYVTLLLCSLCKIAINSGGMAGRGSQLTPCQQGLRGAGHLWQELWPGVE